MCNLEMSRGMRFPTMLHLDKCRLKRACVASFQAQKPQMMFSQQLNTHRIFKRQAKALIRLRVCAGWSETLLVAHTTLLEIPCHGSNVKKLKCVHVQMYNLYLKTKKRYHHDHGEGGTKYCIRHSVYIQHISIRLRSDLAQSSVVDPLATQTLTSARLFLISFDLVRRELHNKLLLGGQTNKKYMSKLVLKWNYSLMRPAKAWARLCCLD